MTKLRGALVGYGFIMENGHAASYRARREASDGVEIVAVADVSAARRALAREHFPGARTYGDFGAMLAAERGGLDFCDIAVPPALHAPVAHVALDAGLHVLCEKPLATTVDDARAMLTHAARARRVLYPCHNYKHAPVVEAVRAVLDQGLIGRPHLVTLQTFRATHARGVADWRPDWRRERALSGGGIAMDHGSHTFYLAFEWMRAYPTAVTARMDTRGPFDTEDELMCSLRFPTGVASAHLSWNAGVRKVLYTIHGDRGAVRVEDDALEVARRTYSTEAAWTFERRQVTSAWMDASHAGWFTPLFEDFRAAIASDDFVGREAREAFLCVQLISTAYASARDGSRELPLRGLEALDGDDLADRREHQAGRARRVEAAPRP